MPSPAATVPTNLLRLVLTSGLATLANQALGTNRGRAVTMTTVPR